MSPNADNGRNPVKPTLSYLLALRLPGHSLSRAPLRALDPFAGVQNRARERAANATRDYGGKLMVSRPLM
jgi:hypothetical protein